MHVREILIELLRWAVDGLLSQPDIDWNVVLNRLEEARALSVDEEGLPASVVSAANLLLDCATKKIKLSDVQAALGKLDVSHGWEAGWGVHLLRKGHDVVVHGDTAMGFSAIAWRNFTRYFATPLGYGLDDASLEQLWNDLRNGIKKDVPMKDLDITDPTGNSSAWVTDDGADGSTLKTTDPTTDVYDQLGLNWTKLAEKDGKTRAVLLSCPLHIRQDAAKSLHCPNSIDGWNNLFFVPRATTDDPWPDHGSRAARPTSDAPTLPEAIHGPAKASREAVNTVALEHEITVGDRDAEYGDQTMQRAIARLREVVVS